MLRRLVALVVAVAVVLVALPVELAAAAQLPGPPDASGNYGVCNTVLVATSQSSDASGNPLSWDPATACNLGAAAATTGQFSHYVITMNGWNGAGETGFTNRAVGTTSSDVHAVSPLRMYDGSSADIANFSAAIVGTWKVYACQTGASPSGATPTQLLDPAGSWKCVPMKMFVSTSIPSPRRSRFAPITETDPAAPAYPGDYFAGGTAGTGPSTPPPAPSPLNAPSYQCQRTLNSSGSGWTATFAALGPFGAPTPAPTTVSEAWSGGFLPAPLPGNTPAAQAVPSPAPVGGWVVTWTGSYTLPADDATHAYTWNVGAQDPLRQLVNGATSWTPTSPIGQTLNSQQLHDLLAGGSTTGATWTNSGHTATLSAVGSYGDLGLSIDGTSYGTVLASFTSSGTSTTAATFRVTTAYGIGGYALPNAVTGASFGTDPRTLTLSCAVLVDLSQPNTGVQATLQPPNSSAPPSSATSPTGSTGSGSCSAGPLGSIPLIGGALDATAELVCAMGDMLGRLLNGLSNLFLSMFVPSSASIDALKHLWDTVTTKAPFSIIVSVLAFIPNTTSAFTSSVSADRYDDGTEKCPTIELNPTGVSIPGAGRTQAGCIPHDSGSDLSLLRGILLALFAVSIALAVVKTTQRVVNGG